MKAFINGPYVNLLCGILLVLTSGIEVVLTIKDGSLGAHHGVLLYGMVVLVKALLHLREGVVDCEEAERVLGKNTVP